MRSKCSLSIFKSGKLNVTLIDFFFLFLLLVFRIFNNVLIVNMCLIFCCSVTNGGKFINNEFNDVYLVTTLDPIPLEAFTLQVRRKF